VPGIWLTLLYFAFLQNLGQTSFDTKFDLTADPGDFLARSLHLWNQESSFGELQNQAYGYLFPQGAFFWVGELAGIPDWVVQRLWSGLLLVVAFEGARRLWRAMAPGASPWSAIVGGLAFATAPRLLGLAGVLSAEVLPTSVLPWVVLPLVLAQTGRLGVRTGALLSGVAVLCMGGVNAVENLAALPLPLLVVLATWRRPGGKRLTAWWAVAMTAAASWWMLPLLVLGKYSPPFLDYIETSIAVVRPLGWLNTVRGADHWVSYYFVGGRAWWPGSYDLSTDALLIALTAVVAALGLAGLVLRSMPWRRPLALSLVVGVLCLTVARAGPLESPLHDFFQYLLDDPLSMLRNVHKVDPLVRLPLALGLAHATAVVLALERTSVRRRVGRAAAVVVVAALVVAAAQPLFLSRMRKEGWTELPDAWQEAAVYLAGPEARGATLVLPGSGFGQQWWGWTIDEPIQGLADSPWVTRSQVPLTPGATIRLLDSIEDRIVDGQGSPELATMLARAGIGQVLVRRDIDFFTSGVPAPARVDLAIARSPGLERVRGFGSSGFGEQTLIDVYRVDLPVERAAAFARSDVTTLAGGPDDILTALEAGDLRPEQPTVIWGEEGWPPEAPDIVGDGYRKRERAFGRLNDAVSQVMAADEPFRTRRAANDYPGVPGAPLVVAGYDDVAAITASSSGGYTDTFGNTRPELGPYSAFDGETTTYWQSAPLQDPVGQWVEARLAEPERLGYVDVRPSTDGIAGVPVREIEVTAGDQVHRVAIDPAAPNVRVPLDGSRVDGVRVTVTEVAGSEGVVAIRDIELQGVELDRRLVVPDTGAGAATDFVFRARPHRRACIDVGLGMGCADESQARPSEEQAGIFREITVHEGGTWTLSGEVVALPADSTQRLLEPINKKVRVRASSTFFDEPGVGAQMAYDGDPSTYWMPTRGTENPTLTLTWPEPRFISGLQIVPPRGEAVAPTHVVLRAGDEVRDVDLGLGGGRFEPLATNELEVVFDTPSPGGPQLGVGDLALRGLDDLRFRIDKDRATGALCGLGPELEVDGKVYSTAVRGTVEDVLDGSPLALRGCSGPVALEPGTHRLELRSTSQFAPTLVNLRADAAERAAPGPRRTVEIGRWDSNDRTLELGAGPESVLVVHENVNAGWEARLDGRLLDSVRVDGWQQGYVVPAGEAGTVILTFAPDRLYRLALLAGAVVAALLVVGALVSRRRDRASALPVLWSGRSPEARALAWPVRLLGLALAALLGGPAFAGGVLLAEITRRWTRAGLLGAALVAVAGVAAGVVAATSPGLPPAWSDALAGIGVGCAVAAVLLHGAPRSPRAEGATP